MAYIRSTDPRPVVDKDDNKKAGLGDRDIVTVDTAPAHDPAANVNLAAGGY